MTQEEIFNKVAEHLLTQKQRAFDPKEEDNPCRYRFGELKCAVGCLITDENYDSKFEGFAVANHRVFEAVEKSINQPLNVDSIALLTVLQKIHDFVDPEQWDERLRMEARCRDFRINF